MAVDRKREREIDNVDFEHKNGDAAPSSEGGTAGVGAEGIPNGGEVNDDDDDDDFGPMPIMPSDAAPAKKRKVMPHEKLYLDQLPSADRYWKSFMHRDTVLNIVLTSTNFLITTSLDGHLKFWKKQALGIEFVKHYRTHLGPILNVAASPDGRSLAALGADTGVGVKGSAKVFDVENFDMINILKLPYVPRSCAWVHSRHDGRILLAITDYDSPAIRLYDGRGDGTPLHTLDKIHRQSVHLLAYNEQYDAVVSVDVGGMIEYWCPREPFEKPENVEWSSKSETGLYEFKKTKSTPVALSLSQNGQHFAILSLPSYRLTTFSFPTGKLHKAYDESLSTTQEMQQGGTLPSGVNFDSMEFGRRLAVERDLQKLALECVARDGDEAGKIGAGVGVGTPVWDESGGFVLYPTMLGIKVVNLITNKVARMLGKDETLRFLNLSLYQGIPIKKGFTTIAMATSDNPLLADKDERDPTLFCTAWKRPRFYMFTRTEVEDKHGDRDVFNEKPTRDEMTVAAPAALAVGPLGKRAVIHTTKGDIALDLYPDLVPKTVENFVGLARKHYYDDVIFHRVIPKFMIQTGDPLGDGTGGESLWGTYFEDEFHSSLRHDRPYTLSMANAGPKTNGSQFFITTAPASWLDNKHSIFGRATSGFEVIHEIENARRDKGDAPYDKISILNVEILA